MFIKKGQKTSKLYFLIFSSLLNLFFFFFLIFFTYKQGGEKRVSLFDFLEKLKWVDKYALLLWIPFGVSFYSLITGLVEISNFFEISGLCALRTYLVLIAFFLINYIFSVFLLAGHFSFYFLMIDGIFLFLFIANWLMDKENGKNSLYLLTLILGLSLLILPKFVSVVFY